MSRRLSPKELEILRLVSEGQSYKGIARSLDVSEATVKHHMANMRLKLGAESSTHLVAQAFREGLVK